MELLKICEVPIINLLVLATREIDVDSFPVGPFINTTSDVPARLGPKAAALARLQTALALRI